MPVPSKLTSPDSRSCIPKPRRAPRCTSWARPRCLQRALTTKLTTKEERDERDELEQQLQQRYLQNLPQHEPLLLVKPEPCPKVERSGGAQLAAALGHVLLRMVSMASAPNRPGQERISCFQSVKLPEVGITSYATRLHRFFRCSGECYVLALVYIDRLLKRQQDIAVTELTCHRLLATSVVLSAKFLDDRYYSNAFYAKVGGLTLTELNGLEKRFLLMLDWRLHVRAEEYTLYHDLLDTVVSRGLYRDQRSEK